MRKIASLLLCGLLLAGPPVLLAGCKPAAAPPPVSIKIGLAVYDQYDTFVGELVQAFTRQARQLEREQGLSITVMQQGAGRKQSLQNSQVENFIEAGCDVVCVNLVDRTDAAVIIDQAVAAGIPILFFNRELVEEDLKRSELLYYVGAVAGESGRMQGELVAELWRKNPEAVDKNGDGVMQYVMLEGEAGHQDAIVRTELALQAVAGAGIEVERLEDEIANWVRAQAETRMNQWLERHGNAIEVVFANNDDMALGAIDALQKAGVGPENWPLVVGIDGTPVGLQAVLARQMAGTVYNDGPGQAQKLLELALALTARQPMPALDEGKYIRLPYQPVTTENVAQFLAKTEDA